MEVSLHRRRAEHPGFDVPHPLQAGLGLGVLGVVPLALGAGGLIRPLSGLVFAGIFLLAGALRSSLAYSELAGLRRAADDELRRRRKHYISSARVSWRSAELTSERHRRSLARAVAHTEHDLSAATLPGASPLNRVAARPHAQLFHELAERIAAVDVSADPRAVLQIEDLLTRPDSPLYDRARAGELEATLLACIDALSGKDGGTH